VAKNKVKTKGLVSKGAKSRLAGKPVKESVVQMTEVVLPSHTNALGTIFGGQIMSWIDIAAAIASSRHARAVCVTASIDALHFLAPARLGQVVCLFACVNATNRTSMEVGVRVESEDQRTGIRKKIAKAYLTFVAVNEKGQPIEVPPAIPESPDEIRRNREAVLRREARLRLKQQLKNENA